MPTLLAIAWGSSAAPSSMRSGSPVTVAAMIAASSARRGARAASPVAIALALRSFLPALSNALTVWSLLDCGSSATMRVAWSRTLRQISSSWGSISTFNDNNLICYLDKSIDAGITI